MEAAGRKGALFEAIAVMGKAFASATRLELLDLLAQGPRTVEQLARASGQSTANTSQHLQALHTAGMVTRTREGTHVRYAMAGDRALRLWLALRDASVAQLAEVERAARHYLGEDVEAIGREELVARAQRPRPSRDGTHRRPGPRAGCGGRLRRRGGHMNQANPTRRRDAFKIATAWLVLVGGLLAAGATIVALALGGLLVAACATVT